MSVTDDPAEFRRLLRPGTVLIYDSLSFEAGLVQWADRAPANHASIILDDEWLIEANRSEQVPPDVATDDPGPAVRCEKLAKRLTEPGIVSITALSHPFLSSDASACAAVLNRARRDLHKGTFAYLDLIFLGPSAFVRSYDQDFKERGLEWVAAMVVLKAFARVARARVPEDAWSLSCSEFVYRCFTEADVPGLGVDIDKPLFAQAPGAGESAERDDHAAAWDELRRHNTLSTIGDKYKKVHDNPVADRVTPGDLLRSTSFRRVATLVNQK